MARAPKANKELPAEAEHDSVCVIVADIGTQKSNNPKYKDARRIVLGLEIPKLSTKDFQQILYQTLTFSPGKKGNMGKVVKNSLGDKKIDMEDYDMRDFLGTFIKVNVEHTDDGEYANIGVEGEIAEGFSPGRRVKPFSDLCAYFIDEHDETEFEALPEWIQKKIIDSPEYDEVATPRASKKTNGKKAAPAKKGTKGKR